MATFSDSETNTRSGRRGIDLDFTGRSLRRKTTTEMGLAVGVYPFVDAGVGEEGER